MGPKERLDEAMRTAVAPQIAAFRRSSPHRCACCGAAPRGGARLEADHVEPSFSRLVAGFRAEWAKAGLHPPVPAKAPGTNRPCFSDAPADQEYSRRWQGHHRRHEPSCSCCARTATSRRRAGRRAAARRSWARFP